jgi:hypothetical protein
LLNLPRNGDKVKIIEVTNIPFTWTPRHTGSPNSAFSTEYIFRLVEIWPATRNPYDAFLSQQPLYETTTTSTQIVYGPAEPALIPGRKYAWQVQAKDTEGRDLFKNEGKSEVYVFQFGDEIGIPQNFRKDGGNASVINLRWEPASDGAIPQQYRVRYRKKSDRDRGVWYESVTPQLWIAVPDLQRDTEYEMQIRAEAAPQYSEYSQSVTFKTSAVDQVLYTCGKEDELVTVNTSSLFVALIPGDIVACGKFKIRVISATGSNGDFTGTGWMSVPSFNGANIRVNFSGQINNNYELVTGGYESVYNQGSAMAQAIDEANQIGEEPKEQPKKNDSTSTPVTPDYIIPGTIDTVYVNEDGKIVVVDTDGNESTYEQKKDEKTGKAKDTVIADAAGNSYTVGSDGKVTKNSTGSVAANPVDPSKLDDFDKLLRTVLLESISNDSLTLTHSVDSLNTDVKNQLSILSSPSDSEASDSGIFRKSIHFESDAEEPLSENEVNTMKQDKDFKVLMDAVEIQGVHYDHVMMHWKRVQTARGYLDKSEFHTLSGDVKQKLTEQKADLKDFEKIKTLMASIIIERINADVQ